jgi:hypothetical protein
LYRPQQSDETAAALDKFPGLMSKAEVIGLIAKSGCISIRAWSYLCFERKAHAEGRDGRRDAGSGRSLYFDSLLPHEYTRIGTKACSAVVITAE